MSNLALQRFIGEAFREDELTLLMANPSFSAVRETLGTFDEAEALIEVGNLLLIEAEKNSRRRSGNTQSL